jgi:ATP-dependent Clp protease ATP-binding subunit ClpA
MPRRLSPDVRNAVLTAAATEASNQGDRRIGTEHLLLALLHDQTSPAAQALGVTLDQARAASQRLDVEALATVGINVAAVPGATAPARVRRLRPLTSGSRSVLVRSVNESRERKMKYIDATHFLLALLECQRPDAAAALLHALGVDSEAVRQRLSAKAV